MLEQLKLSEIRNQFKRLGLGVCVFGCMLLDPSVLCDDLKVRKGDSAETRNSALAIFHSQAVAHSCVYLCLFFEVIFAYT